MYKINVHITLYVPNSYYKGRIDEIANYIHKKTGLDYEVLNISKRVYDNNNNISTFDLELLFIIIDKNRAPELVGDLENRFMKLYEYDYKAENIKVSLNEVFVKLEEKKKS